LLQNGVFFVSYSSLFVFWMVATLMSRLAIWLMQMLGMIHIILVLIYSYYLKCEESRCQTMKYNNVLWLQRLILGYYSLGGKEFMSRRISTFLQRKKLKPQRIFCCCKESQRRSQGFTYGNIVTLYCLTIYSSPQLSLCNPTL
jgi:hypothetical protein